MFEGACRPVSLRKAHGKDPARNLLPAGPVCSTKPSSGAHEYLAEKNFLDKNSERAGLVCDERKEWKEGTDTV